MKEFVEKRLRLKRKVLVVDDEDVERRMLAKMLEEHYDVFLACNGEEALQVMRENNDTLSLVLLDIMMPKMDGFAVLHEVGLDENLSKIPIIVLTSENDAEVKSLNMGAADFVPKPYDVPEVILARIGKTIQLYENQNMVMATRTDRLTGLFQKAYFINYAKIADHYAPEQERDIMVLNINRFHIINEMHGREHGDHLLREIGTCVKQYVEEKRGVACRSNADTFVLYVPHQEEPEKLLWQLHVRLEDTLDDPKNRIRMGIYSRVDKTLSLEKRVDCALLACNSIKSNYKVNVAYYDVAMHEKESYEEQLTSELDRALAENQFIVYYQPKFGIQEEPPYLYSAEALLRWKHPEFGLLHPTTFIPLFESNGRIHQLDFYMWKQAAKQVAEWKKQFGISIPVSVNVSRIDIMEPEFVEEICSIVKEAEISPRDFLLEITESAYTEDAKGIVDTVRQLKNLGFHIEMDDFGTGYSSLNMLTEMPIDVLKLDMGFVERIHRDSKTYRMVEIIMEFAAFLDVKVVAEGVELEEQYELLKKAGVHVIQGFFYSRPVPPQQFERFIRERMLYENT